GHEPHRHEEPAPPGGGDGAAPEAPPGKEEEHQVEEGEGDAEPSHPLAGRADPAVRKRHASRNLSLRRDRRENDDERRRSPRRLHGATWRLGSSSASRP